MSPAPNHRPPPPGLGKATKVAIIGTTPSRTLAPYSDESWEIWAGHDFDLPRWTRWFELHDHEMLRGKYPELWNWMVDQVGPRPIYLSHPVPDIASSVKYPRGLLPTWLDPMFLSSTVAWELALAIHLGATEIGIWGVDMSTGDEYRAQKPGCRALVMLARSQGIRVTVPEDCELLKPVPAYQLGEQPWRLRQMEARAEQVRAELDLAKNRGIAAEREALGLQGALEALQYSIRNWG